MSKKCTFLGLVKMIIIILIIFITSCEKKECTPGINVNFNADKTIIHVDETIAFVDLSVGEPDVWNWEFEGGTPTTSTEQNPRVSYSQPGTFSVELTSSNSEKSDVELKTGFIIVLSKVTALFSASDTLCIQGSEITFTDNSKGEPTEWLWEFEEGTPTYSTEQNPMVLYSQPGTFSVKLTSSNSEISDVEFKIGFIKVLSPVTALFSVSDTVFGQGSEITFTDNSKGEPTEWLWEFEEGTPASSTDQNPIVTFSKSGIYNVKLTVANLLSSDSITKSINSMPTEGLVAYYPFSGSPIDETGNGHDGVASGGINLTTDRFNNVNSAYEFDGINDFINTSSIFDFSSRSLSLWINPYDISGSVSTVKVAISQDDDELDYGILRVDFEDYYMNLWAGGSSGKYTTPDVSINSWVHLVLIRDEERTIYYVNNVLVYTSTSDGIGSTWGPNPEFIIGSGRHTTDQFFKGKIDDIRIFNRVINESEIQTLYAGH